MNEKLKIALFGSGKMGLHHLKAISRLSNAEVIGIADPRADIDQIKETIGKEPQLFSSAEELLKNIQPDVVHIVTPPHLHFEMAKLALNHNAHILIEKPFVEKLKEADEILKLAKEKKLLVAAGHQLLFQEPVQLAEKLLKYIGDVIYVESYFSFKTVRRSISPVDQLLDILPHPVYSMLKFMNVDSTSKTNKITVSGIDVDPSGEARAIIKNGNISSTLVVSLNARPVDSYLNISGTNGQIHIDFVRSLVKKFLGPGADSISAVINPFRLANQTVWKTISAILKRILKKQKSYPGLYELFKDFYTSISLNNESPLSPVSILETVRICDQIGKELKAKEKIEQEKATKKLEKLEKELPLVEAGKGVVCLTGGTGFLGKVVAKELREKNWAVRVLCRSIPSVSRRLPGVEYFATDLTDELSDDIFKDVSAVVHCAAETAGGQKEHEKNSIFATKNLIEAAAKNKIKKFIHISSLAVLKTGKEVGGALEETSPVDYGNLGRGPYVWGKAEAEKLIMNMEKDVDMDIKIVRPGPLVDYNHFEAPGRLGKEAGSRFVVMGSKSSSLSVCDVNSAAKVIRYYLSEFDSAPKILNMVEPEAPTRKELISRLLADRIDLKPFYIPNFVVAGLAAVLKLVQKIIFPSKKPVDIRAVFSSEEYNTKIVGEVLRKAGK